MEVKTGSLSHSLHRVALTSSGQLSSRCRGLDGESMTVKSVSSANVSDGLVYIAVKSWDHSNIVAHSPWSKKSAAPMMQRS